MDRDWAERLRRSDVSALEEVMDAYSAYAAKIIAACLGQALPKEDMEEALADVFVKLWDSRRRLRGEVKPYLAAIARNAARDRLRSLRPELPAQEGLPDEAPPPEELAELRERDETVRRAVEAMSPPDRELFIRFYYLEQTVGEISAVTGQNPSTVKSRLRRGREKLRGYLLERGICHG